MIKLYHYIHCPYCVRVRLVLGLLNLEWESAPLPYHDEKTPLDLTGVKMLPIIEIEGAPSNESLDIIVKLDKDNALENSRLEDKKLLSEVENILSQFSLPVHSLCMPYWAWTKEFNEVSRNYFQTKKEKKRGPFHLLVQDKQKYLDMLPPLFEELAKELKPYFRSDKLTILDIMISSHLWGLYIYPEFQFPKEIHEYLMKIKESCKFDYHEDFWKEA